MLLNITNHHSHHWSNAQKQASATYGEIIDIPFPEINGTMNDETIANIVNLYFDNIKKYENPVILIQGEYIFTYRLVKKLKEHNYITIAACSDKRTVEYINDLGNTMRTSEFEFSCYKEY